MNALVFFGGENMGADGQVVVVAIDKLEGQHSVLSIQHSARRAPKTPYHTRLLEFGNKVVSLSFVRQRGVAIRQSSPMGGLSQLLNLAIASQKEIAAASECRA
jgi:hypothetical protein